MKKMLFFAAIALAALGSCTSDEFVGENQSSTSQDSGAIAFTSGTKNITRATGADAAALLHNNFVVEGIKTIPGSGSSPTTVEVFDNYNVNYSENTADKTASNTANWEYVNQPILSGKTAVSEQTIKYWDFAASQYDFWAYSLGEGSAASITVSELGADGSSFSSGAYTISGSLADLAKVYISDLQTAYNPVKSVSGVANETTEPRVMGNVVDLNFRSLVTKVRMGLYETIPGYSVRNVQFYPSANGELTTTATLYASTATLPAVPTGGNAEYKITFPTTGPSNISNSDYNKAHVTATTSGEGNTTSTVTFGTLSYGAHQDGKHEKEGYTEATNTWTEIWVQRSANTVTWAKESGDGVSAGDYSIVLPYETGAVLTLKVDYTLESIDGSGETITVHGATALVPSQYTQWKPNYAYTYLFKISDNTNGLTNITNTDKIGLYPITLDAVVTGAEDGTQETITTVATPSITTYSVTSNVTTNNEYTTSDEIYITVNSSTEHMLESLADNAVLYDITKSDAAYGATEAEVLEALTKYSSFTSNVYTGRNSVVLTPAQASSTDILDLSQTSIPTVDNQTLTVAAGTVGYIAKNKLTAGHYYAFVYNTTSGTPTTEVKYEAITTTAGTTVVTGKWYKNSSNEWTEVTGEGTTADNGVTYYDKYTTSTATYAIKVIKIKS